MSQRSIASFFSKSSSETSNTNSDDEISMTTDENAEKQGVGAAFTSIYR